MASFKTGRFTLASTDSGTKQITGIGFQPDIVILQTANVGTSEDSQVNGDLTFSYGAYDGTRNVANAIFSEGGITLNTNGCCGIYDTRCLVGIVATDTLDYELSGSSLDTGGFTLTINSAPTSDQYIYYMCIGGVDAECGTFQAPASTAKFNDYKIDMVGTFTPNVVLFAGASGDNTSKNSLYTALSPSIGFGAVTDNDLSHHQKQFGAAITVNDGMSNDRFFWHGNDSCDQDDLACFAPGGNDSGHYVVGCRSITSGYINLTTIQNQNGNAYHSAYIAIGGVKAILDFGAEPATDTTSAISAHFTPDAALSMSAGHIYYTCRSKKDDAYLMSGMTDGTNDYVSCIGALRSSNPSSCRSGNWTQYVKFFTAVDGATSAGETGASFSTDSLDMSWTNTDGTARYIGHVLLGDPDEIEVEKSGTSIVLGHSQDSTYVEKSSVAAVIGHSPDSTYVEKSSVAIVTKATPTPPTVPTVYFAGSEADVVGCDSRIIDTVDGFDSNFSRASLELDNLNTMSFALNTEVQDNSADGYWVHCRLETNYSATDPDDNNKFIEVRDSTFTLSTLLYFTSDVIQARVYGDSGGSNTTSSGEQLPGVSGTATYDLHVYTSGGNSILDFYIDEVLEATATVTGEANRGAQYVQFYAPANYTSRDNWFSEFIVADTDTRGWRVKTLVPNADGFYTDWTGTYADIDAAAETGGIQSTGIGQIQTYETAGLGTLHQQYEIRAVCLNTKAANNGTNDLQTLMRKGGSDYFSPSLGTTTGSVGYHHVWSYDPSTNSAWASTDLTELEFGFKSVT